MSVELLVALILILLLAVLALLVWAWKTGAGGSGTRKDGRGEDSREIAGGTECPLCGEFLPRGTRVHSVVFPGREFDLMRIYGCPYCRADVPNGAGRTLRKRHCPYCGEEIPAEGYVMAKVYRKPYRKTHVHVYGCTVCKPGRG